MRLRVQLALVPDSVEPARTVCQFDTMFTVRRAGQRLHIVHQHLLGLFPESSASLIDDARILRSHAVALLEDHENFEIRLGVFVTDTQSFATRLRMKVGDGP